MPTGPDNVVLNKAAAIERSLRRMRQEYAFNPALDNYTHIDAMILNIERACQAAIDLAQHLVAENHLGVPQSSAELFILLKKAKMLSEETTRAMIAMTGFRNVAIHEYQELEMDILRAIAEKEYKSLISFCKEAGVEIRVTVGSGL
jgi:uncharacterized protein YutE (UPF0331/DUF86 family)